MDFDCGSVLVSTAEHLSDAASLEAYAATSRPYLGEQIQQLFGATWWHRTKHSFSRSFLGQLTFPVRVG